MDDGHISEHGTYDELMTHDGPFARFLLQHLRNEPQEDVDDPESRLNNWHVQCIVFLLIVDFCY